MQEGVEILGFMDVSGVPLCQTCEDASARDLRAWLEANTL
jgi:hypothetical protein